MKLKKQPLAFTPHKKRLLSAVIGSICAAMASQPVQASTLSQYWKGAGTDANIDTLANWETGILPVTGTDASLSFNSYVVGTGSLTVNNNLIQAPIYNTLKFFNGGFNLTGNQIALRPTSFNSTVINNVAGSNTISAPLRIDPNLTNSVALDNAQIAVVNGSLTLDGNVSASQVNLSTLLGANANLSMNGVSAKSFNATGGTHNLTGVLDSAAINLQSTNFIVGGAGGSIYGDVSMGSGSQLTLDNTAAVSSNRLGGYGLKMGNDTTLLLKGNATTDVADYAWITSPSDGVINDMWNIKVEGAGANVLLTVSGQNSNQFGLINYASNGVLGDQERIKFDYIFRPDRLLNKSLVNGHELAFYDAAKGVVAATNATSVAGASVSSNVYLTSTENLTGNATINSLAVNNTDISADGAHAISLISGKLLTTGTVNIAPTIDFGTGSTGEMINLGNTVLAGGLNGNRSLLVSGGGQLELQSAGGFSGYITNQGTLLLSADNVLHGVSVYNNAVLAIGSTTQNLRDLGSTGNVTGNGRIVSENGISLSQNLVNVSLEGQNVGFFDSYNPINSNFTVNGDIHASQSVSLYSSDNYNGTINGVISGAANINILNNNSLTMGSATFTNQNTYTGLTAGNLVLTGNGAITASSGFGGNLTMRSGDGDNGSLDRIGDAAAVTLSLFDYNSGKGSRLSMQGSGSVNMYEDIGTLNVGQGARIELSNGTGTTGLRADALNLYYDASLTLSLGNASSFYVDVAPNTYTNTDVVKDVYVEKSIDGKFLPSWAAYDASNGRIYEAVVAEKTLDSAGSNEFVRATDTTNQILTANHTVGALNIDTNQEMSGSGTLTVSSGQLLFWKDNTINMAGLNFGLGFQQGVVINSGTNTIASVIDGYELVKKGEGTLILTASNHIWGKTEVKHGVLSVASSGSIGDVWVDYNGQLDVAGSVGNIHNGGNVNLNTAYNVSTDERISNDYTDYGTLHVHAGLTNNGQIDNLVDNTSTVTNNGFISGVINKGILTNAVGARIMSLTHNSATAFTNEGTVDLLSNSGTVVNRGAMSSLENSGTFTNNGRLDYSLNNTGTFTNNGTLEVSDTYSWAHFGGTVTNAGTVIINQGTQVDGDTDLNTGAVTSTYTQTAGITTVNGYLADNVSLEGGILKGTGIIAGNLTVLSGAQVNPGNSPGLLTVYGDFMLGTGSLLNMEVVNDNGVLKYDQLYVGGNFTKNGGIKFILGTGVDFNNNEFSANGQKINLANIFNDTLLTSLTGSNLLVSGLNGVIQNWLVTASMASAAPLVSEPVSAVPVPAAVWLFGTGLLGFTGFSRKRKAA